MDSVMHVMAITIQLCPQSGVGIISQGLLMCD